MAPRKVFYFLAGKLLPSRLLSTTLNIALSYVSHLFYLLFGMVMKHCLQHYGINLNVRYIRDKKFEQIGIYHNDEHRNLFGSYVVISAV
jgi:AraC-like DNA-binding protein